MCLHDAIIEEIDALNADKREALEAGNGTLAECIGYRIHDLYEVIRVARAADSPELREAARNEYDPANPRAPRPNITAPSRAASRYSGAGNRRRRAEARLAS
jgi:hypothetical protein